MFLNRLKFCKRIARQHANSPKKQESPSTGDKLYKSYTSVPPSEWKWTRIPIYAVACKGTGQIRINKHALDCLSALQQKVGSLNITSGYRSVEHNQRVGGAKNSYHTKGMAFDLAVVSSSSAKTLIDAAKASGFQGIGTYPERSFIHVDTGPPRRWGKEFPKHRLAENNVVAKPLAQSRTIAAGRKAGVLLVFDLVAKTVSIPMPEWMKTIVGVSLGILTLSFIAQMIYCRILQWEEDF